MRADLILLAPIVCFVVGACASPGTAPAAADQLRTAPEPVDWGPARSHPHDYPGPPLRGGNGGG